jgi:hypothetical protein
MAGATTGGPVMAGATTGGPVMAGATTAGAATAGHAQASSSIQGSASQLGADHTALYSRPLMVCGHAWRGRGAAAEAAEPEWEQGPWWECAPPCVGPVRALLHVGSAGRIHAAIKTVRLLMPSHLHSHRLSSPLILRSHPLSHGPSYRYASSASRSALTIWHRLAVLALTQAAAAAAARPLCPTSATGAVRVLGSSHLSRGGAG